jgi:hypothetical protein
MAVTSIELTRRELVGAGKSFGAVGPYELLTGVVGFGVDPDQAAHRCITDLELAPRGADGRVHFDADFALMRPVKAGQGNGRLLFDVPNRGRRMILSSFNRGGEDTEPGDGFLMERGYTIAWCGWQHNVSPGPGQMELRAPPALVNGEPVAGLVMCEYQTAKPTQVVPVADRGHRAYPALDPADPTAVLRVREHLEAPATIVPRERWQFARLEGGRPVADPTSLYLATGFEPGKLYDLVYTAGGAAVIGVGLLAVRDVVSWLRYGDAASGNPAAGSFERAYAFGISQSGHFLRHFLYLGLNEDDRERMVFDAVFSLIGCARRGEFNIRFGQPEKTLGRYVGELFPFSDLPQTDPVTGETDGLLARLIARGKVPKIFYLDSSAEYWSRQAGLIHSEVDGSRDLAPPETTRVYHLTGTQHGSGVLPLDDSYMGTVRLGNARNSVNYQPLVRSALVNLDAWVSSGREPPPSRHPRLDEGTAALPGEVLDYFRGLPDVHVPAHLPPLPRYDFGPETARGVLTELPPREGPPYTAIMPAIDADGNETAGVALPDITVPLATYTGWNVRHPDSGAPDEWLLRAGATLPFPRTAAERQATGDPRRSIEERYASKEAYLESVRLAAEELVAARYVLAEDVEGIVERSALRWDLFTSTPDSG